MTGALDTCETMDYLYYGSILLRCFMKMLIIHSLKLLPKLTYDHISLNAYSKMQVNLAAQVLSASMAAVLRSFGPTEAAATATYCKMVDGFIGCLNVRSTTEYQRQRKPFFAPYRDVHDKRYVIFYFDYESQLVEFSQMLSAHFKFTKLQRNYCRLLYFLFSLYLSFSSALSRCFGILVSFTDCVHFWTYLSLFTSFALR